MHEKKNLDEIKKTMKSKTLKNVLLSWHTETLLFASSQWTWKLDGNESTMFHFLKFSLHLFQKFRTEETTLILTKQKPGHPADSGRKLPVRVEGKEVKRPLFVSKPPTIHFKVELGRQSPSSPAYNGGLTASCLIHSKDFDVGKTYKKKITLINSSSVADHCRFLRVSSQLHDFISIK